MNVTKLYPTLYDQYVTVSFQYSRTVSEAALINSSAQTSGSGGGGGGGGGSGATGATGATGGAGPTGATGVGVNLSGIASKAVIFNQSSTISGSPNFVYDASTTRVGINISTPAYDLDVSGTTNLNGTLVSNRTISGVDLEIFTRAVAGVDPFAAGGGTATTYLDASGNAWAAHSFSTAGTFTFTNASPISNARVLVVGGGGGGGGQYGGGGGAGGLVSGNAITIPAGTLSLTVGAGGTAGVAVAGLNGGNSTVIISGVTYTGQGGGGGGSYNGPQNAGRNGGCGGGGGNTTGGSGTQGFGGGTGGFGNGGAGGGGMGAAGSNSGNAFGGIGVQSDITGVNTYYAGGGGGGSINNTLFISGGLGGGGNGGTSPTAGTDGLGGGGGGAANDGTTGRNGGSGTVILAYSLAQFGTFVNPYGTIAVDATCNLALTPSNYFRVRGPTEYRRIVSNVSAASLTLSSNFYSTAHLITGAGLTSTSVPTLTASDAGVFWDLVNTTVSSLSFAITGTTDISSPVSVTPGATYTIMWNGTRYFGLRGAAGATGATGATGSAGATGATGTAGIGTLNISEISGTSLTLSLNNANTFYHLQNSGFNALTFPSTLSTASGGTFWTLRNATNAYLTMTLTNNLNLTSPLTIPPASSQTFAVSALSGNTILLF